MEPDKIRVLIVDDIPDVRENLRKLLYFERDIEVAGLATNGHEAVELAQELQPDVVLMDINMPGMDGIAASEAISGVAPAVQIIMMSVQGETDYLRRSMLAGAKGFLIKPFGSDEMVNTIHNVYNLRPKTAPAPAETPRQRRAPAFAEAMPQQMADQGAVIAVYSPKGGVGCSLIASNVAIGLRNLTEKKVVLVDGDLQFGDIGVLLNLSSDHTLAELATKQGQMDSELMEILACPHLSGIKVLLPPARPEEADLLNTEHMREALDVLREMFDYVVVDTPSSLDDTTLAVLDMADCILLVTTADIPTIKNARLLFDVTDAMSYPENKIKLLLNQHERNSSIGPKEITAGIKHAVYATIPVDRKTAYTSVNQGVPCIVDNANSSISQSLLKIAANLIQDLSPATKQETPPKTKQNEGILSRLLKR